MNKLFLNICFFLFTGISVETLAQTGNLIAAGGDHSLFICDSKAVMSTGLNNAGQLGIGTSGGNSTSPVNVNSLTGIISVASGKTASHSLFLKNDGTVWACGANGSGQLGIGSTITQTSPVQITALSGITAIASGRDFSLFLKNDGTVYSCGFNNLGQLGDGTNVAKSTPAQIIGLSGITKIAAGDTHSMFLKNDGTVWMCGSNFNGQLCNGNTTSQKNPVLAIGLSGITAIAGGSSFSLFIKNDGTAWGCGTNSFGQLGNGTTTTTNMSPVQASGLNGMSAIAAGVWYSLFLKNDGTVWATGYNLNGQLGDGTTVNKTTPINVSALSGITAITAGGGNLYGNDHSLFLKNNGEVWACGSNGYGQLGDGTTSSKLTPVKVLGLCLLAGIEEHSVTMQFQVFPNPNNGSFILKTDSEIENGELVLINLLGQKVYEQAISKGENIINKNGLTQGLYNYIILQDNRQISKGKVAIE